MMIKKRIGLITFHGRNYGSNLQCYATKTFIENLGFDCDLLTLKIAKLNILQRVAKILVKIIKNPSILRMRYKEKKYRSSLSVESAKLMDGFDLNILKPRLIDINNDLNQYDFFITGSDQVWNVSCGVSSTAFLQFAPRRKRIALATSFGISEIPFSNQRELSNALNGFDYISVREETGVEIVKKFSNVKVCRIADPTFIYNAEEWRDFAGNHVKYPRKFILVHFLNEPNDIAIDSIKFLSKKFLFDVVVVGYKYNVLEKISRNFFVDGGPWDYVSLIDQAEFVLTDSFHSILFSLNFNKEFFVFSRHYLTSKQSSRITDLLKRFKLQNRLVCKIESFEENYCKKLPDNIGAVLEHERFIIRDFIINAISGKMPTCFFS